MQGLLKKLSEAYGPSGREEEIRSIIRGEVQGKVDEVLTDSLGNLIATRRGGGKKIMVAAHMDEIGLMVTHVDDKGFLRFAGIGGISPYSLVGRRFDLPGGIVATAGVEKPENLKELSFNKMYLDIGAKDEKEALRHVNIGDMAVYHAHMREAMGRYSGKAMDDRVGCAMLIKALENLETENEIYLVFTVQEELGLRGARTAAYRLNPDIGLAVDVTRVGDTPEAATMAVSLGKGPTVKIKDSSVICHPWVKDQMIRMAEKHKIPYQREVLERGGTDAGAIHISREGVPSGVLSVPCRYIHTAAEMVDQSDVAYGVQLLKALLEDPWEQ
jgi:tetrahedral aminopeptidase